MQKEKQRKNSKKIIKRILIFLVIILVIASLILVIIDFNLLSPVLKIFKKPTLINIDDKCALIMNRLIHKIKDQGDCKNNCNNECSIIQMNFYNIEFTGSEKECNICKCYCK